MEIKFYNPGEIENNRFKYAIICASYRGKWIYVKNMDRKGWEIPGGHREEDEDINRTAARELFEETGAVRYDVIPVCDYSVTIDEITAFGRLFYGDVIEMGPLPESEICEIKLIKAIPDSLEYPQIQTQLYQKVLEYLKTRALNLLCKDMERNVNMINFI